MTSVIEQDDQEPPMKKLAILVPREEEVYSYTREIKCFLCPQDVAVSPEDARAVSRFPGSRSNYRSSYLTPLRWFAQLEPVSQGIVTAMASAQQSEVKAWEEEITACE